MTERSSPRQVHEAVGVEDWPVLVGGACAHDRTGSCTVGVALARQVSAAARELGVPADPTAVPTVQVTIDSLVGPEVMRSATAIAAGGHLVTDQYAPAWWVLADAEGNEACVATAS